MKGVALHVLTGLLLPTMLRAAGPLDYARDVKPVLAERCISCHGPLRQRSDLRLDTAVLVRKGGRGGPAVVPGKSSKSPLLQRVRASEESERMPPEGSP